MSRKNRAAALGAALLLAGCASTPSAPPEKLTPAPTAIAVAPKAQRAPDARVEASAPALQAFRRACPRLLRRQDASGLTVNEDWKPACADQEADPTIFFARHFTPVKLGDGQGMATGYYEPEIAGFATAMPGAAPILSRPPELVDVDLKLWDIPGGTLRGIVKDNRIVRAPDRAAIEEGAFAGRRLELGWAKDPVDLFFLQIQGSGRMALPDGRIIRLGYDGQNGHPYVAIGKLLRERGLLPKAGMQEIRDWLAANPEAGKALMRENKSYIFFRRLPDAIDGPPGALGVPLIPLANVAADPAMLPLGAPVWIETMVEGQMFRKMLVASDTGGAIKGANRFDIFFGAGTDAARKAGGLSAPLSAVILLPNMAAARLAP